MQGLGEAGVSSAEREEKWGPTELLRLPGPLSLGNEQVEEEQESEFRKITLGRAQASTLRSPPRSRGKMPPDLT